MTVAEVITELERIEDKSILCKASIWFNAGVKKNSPIEIVHGQYVREIIESKNVVYIKSYPGKILKAVIGEHLFTVGHILEELNKISDQTKLVFCAVKYPSSTKHRKYTVQEKSQSCKRVFLKGEVFLHTVDR